MAIMYKERLKDKFEVIYDAISGYYEIYKNQILKTATQDLVAARFIFSNL